MRTVVITPPDPVISWSEVAFHLALEEDDDRRPQVERLVAAATAHIDGPDRWLGRAIGEQVLEARFDLTEVGRSMRLRCPPVVELHSVTWLDFNRTEVSGDIADFQLFGAEGAELAPVSGDWPWVGGPRAPEAGRIQYVAGYAVVPEDMKAAILLMVGDMFDQRASVTSWPANSVNMSTTVEHLLSPFRVWA